jgi:hypothetical protein
MKLFYEASRWPLMQNELKLSPLSKLGYTIFFQVKTTTHFIRLTPVKLFIGCFSFFVQLNSYISNLSLLKYFTHYSHFCKLSFFKDASERHLNNFIIWHLWLSILFIFGQVFHYVLFLEYISVDADGQDSDRSVDSN